MKASAAAFSHFLHYPLISLPKRLATSTVTASKAAVFSPDLKILDSHLHVWASPQQAEREFPYHPGLEPSVPGDAELLLKCMDEAGVGGALIVQPINHMFDHSLVTSVLRRYPSKFIGCCLANPSEDASGIKQLEDLVLKDGYRSVRFNPYLWPSGQKMTNEIGKALFAKAGELGIPVGIMCMKGLNLHILEIEELCMNYPKTIVILDHMGFCKPPTTEEERKTLSSLLNLARFPQVYVKFSALFRLSRNPYPYEDTSDLLSQVVARYGANKVMWGSDFPFVVQECGYKEMKEAIVLNGKKISLQESELEWIMGGTLRQLFQHTWLAA